MTATSLRPGNDGEVSSGFSLIEVVITLGILMSLTIAVASMLRAGFDVKEGLSQRAKVVHRLSTAITRVADDVEHTFYVSLRNSLKVGTDRRMKTAFRIEKSGTGNDRLALTTKTHRAMQAGSNESDLTFVMYELRDSRESPGRKDLYRGETKVIPEDLKEEPQMRLLAKSIKSFKLEPWNGDKYTGDYWDTNRGDTRNILPKLVRITIEAYTEDRVEGDGQDETVDQGTDMVSTVVYLSESWEYADQKTQNSSIKWNDF